MIFEAADQGGREKETGESRFLLFCPEICAFTAGFLVTTRRWSVLEDGECDS
jgi:hypothetical protein